MKLAAVITIALVMLASCSPSNERFDSATDLAEALGDSGISCDYIPVEQLRAPFLGLPKGESGGQCDGIAIAVLGEKDALARLRRGEAHTSDDTPRIYWVYGDNWFIATENSSIRDRIARALGGSSTDNTKL